MPPTSRGDVPNPENLMWPTLKALDQMGGSATIHELTDKVAEVLELNDEVMEVPHTTGNLTSFQFKCGWARTNLKYIEAVENSHWGTWTITNIGRQLISNEDEVVRRNREERARRYQARTLERQSVELGGETELNEEDVEDLDQGWEDALLSVLKEMDPSAFERLCQRLLREAGFSKVEVTGQVGDGGIDGVGVQKISLLSFHVRFQCKRYTGSVSSPDIRNFRGAMQGRADKGLFITTGRFTRDAEAEAIRDGAPPIDLIDGLELCSLLKTYSLGVSTHIVEEVSVSREFFMEL